MLVLAVESATELAGVALADEGGVIASATVSKGRRHAEAIAPSISFLCERTGASLSDLDGICVDIGPGLFTGLRVGISTAKGLAFALGIPVVTATSLEVLAHAMAGADVRDGARIVPVVDARRKEVFSASYAVAHIGDGEHRTPGAYRLERLDDDKLSEPEDLALSIADSSGEDQLVVLGGDGALRYRHVLADPLTRAGQGVLGSQVEVILSDIVWPPVEVLAQMGIRLLSSGAAVDATEVTARYLREADVRINWEQRLPPRSYTASPAGASSPRIETGTLLEATHCSAGGGG